MNYRKYIVKIVAKQIVNRLNLPFKIRLEMAENRPGHSDTLEQGHRS